jgi:hypothetical protein
MKINFMEKTVLVTKSELSKASVYGSNEYYELLAIRKDLPDYQIVVKSASPRRTCFSSPTYEFMAAYLSSNENTASLYEEFLQLRRAGYNYNQIKKWFMEKFPASNTKVA